LASGGPRTGRGPLESRAFVEGYRPPHPNEIERLTRGGWRCVKICAPACTAMRRGGGWVDTVWSGEWGGGGCLLVDLATESASDSSVWRK